MTNAFSAAAMASALVLVVGVAGGFAAEERWKTRGQSGTQSERMSSQTERSGAAAQTGESMALGEMKGMHTMEGEVTKIDHNSGKFSIKTSGEGTLDLHVPPTALQGVKKGDRVAVVIGINPSPSAAMTPGTRSSQTGGGAGAGAGGATTTTPSTPGSQNR